MYFRGRKFSIPFRSNRGQPLLYQVWSNNKAKEEGVWGSEFNEEYREVEKGAGFDSWLDQIEYDYAVEEAVRLRENGVEGIQDKRGVEKFWEEQ